MHALSVASRVPASTHGAAAETSTSWVAVETPAMKPPAKKLLSPPIRAPSAALGNELSTPYGTAVKLPVTDQGPSGTTVKPLSDGAVASAPGFRMRLTAGSALLPQPGAAEAGRTVTTRLSVAVAPSSSVAV